MNPKSIISSIVVSVVVVLIAFWAWQPEVPEPVVIEKPVQVGSVTSPDVTSDFISFNGKKLWIRKSTFAGNAVSSSTAGLATSTVCVIPAPPSGTSTLVAADFDAKKATSTVSRLTMARGVDFNSTTTAFFTDYIYGANSKFHAHWDTASATVIGKFKAAELAATSTIFTPSDYLVFGLAGDSGEKGFRLSGSCAGLWEEIQ